MPAVLERPARIWRAQAKQVAFLRRTEDEVLFGGAAGGGKSDALLVDLIRTCTQHPGAKTLFLRRTFADLSKPGAAIDRSRELLTGLARWDGQNHRWTFDRGSILQFGHLQNPGDVYGYQGAQFDRLAWDELTQFEYEQYQFLRSRVRATVPGIKTAIRAATNPGGIGHGWVRARWIDAAPWGEPFTIPTADGSRGISACFIPAKLDDNAALLERDPEYRARLGELPDDLRRAYLEGDWDLFAGQVFTEWRRERHVVEPAEIPDDWPRWRAVDYGFNAPMCCLWLARDHDRRVHVYRELHERGLTDTQQAQTIRDLTGDEPIRFTVVDPSMFSRQPNGTSIAEVYARHGVPVVPGNNDRLAGLQRVHQFLTWTEAKAPLLRVSSGCPNLIRTLPALVYDKHKVEDVDTDGDDHDYDALRYGLMGGSVQRGRGRVTEFAVQV